MERFGNFGQGRAYSIFEEGDMITGSQLGISLDELLKISPRSLGQTGNAMDEEKQCRLGLLVDAHVQSL